MQTIKRSKDGEHKKYPSFFSWEGTSFSNIWRFSQLKLLTQKQRRVKFHPSFYFERCWADKKIFKKKNWKKNWRHVLSLSLSLSLTLSLSVPLFPSPSLSLSLPLSLTYSLSLALSLTYSHSLFFLSLSFPLFSLPLSLSLSHFPFLTPPLPLSLPLSITHTQKASTCHCQSEKVTNLWVRFFLLLRSTSCQITFQTLCTLAGRSINTSNFRVGLL